MVLLYVLNLYKGGLLLLCFSPHQIILDINNSLKDTSTYSISSIRFLYESPLLNTIKMLYSTLSSLLFAAVTSAAAISSVSGGSQAKRNGYGMTPFYKIVSLVVSKNVSRY